MREWLNRPVSQPKADAPSAQKTGMSTMYYSYVIWSNKLLKRYIGSTQNIEKRLNQHNSGKTPFTLRGIPWILIYSESFETKDEAIRREKFLKSGIGRKWLDEKFPQYRRLKSL